MKKQSMVYIIHAAAVIAINFIFAFFSVNISIALVIYLCVLFLLLLLSNNALITGEQSIANYFVDKILGAVGANGRLFSRKGFILLITPVVLCLAIHFFI